MMPTAAVCLAACSPLLHVYFCLPARSPGVERIKIPGIKPDRRPPAARPLTPRISAPIDETDMALAIPAFDIDFNDFGFSGQNSGTVPALEDHSFVAPVLGSELFSSCSSMVDAFLDAPATVWPLQTTTDLFPAPFAHTTAPSVVPSSFPSTSLASSTSSTSVRLPCAAPKPLAAPAKAAPVYGMSECSFRSLSPVPSPAPVALRPRPTISKPLAGDRSDADARQEDRRRRNRESSARCYYNRKRRLVAASEDLAAMKRRAVGLYARELELRNENARLKKELVLDGGCIPLRMLAPPVDR